MKKDFDLNKRKIFETGSILFLFGGIIPMIYTIGILPEALIWYSLGEIFLQNFISGILTYKIFIYRKTRFTHTNIRFDDN